MQRPTARRSVTPRCCSRFPWRAGNRQATDRFDGLYGQDAFAYYGYALQLRTALAGLHPPPPFFWPVGYPALVARRWRSSGRSPGRPARQHGRRRHARPSHLRAGPRGPARRSVGALGAGALMAVASQLLISSLSVMSDASALAWLTLSAAALLRYTTRLERAGSPFRVRLWVGGPHALGLRACRRPWALAAGWRGGRRGFRAPGRWRDALAVALGALVVGAQFGGTSGARAQPPG